MSRKKKRTARGIAVGYLPPPTDFGAPPKFTSWRDEQEEALVLLTESSKRVSVLEMPTGSGKALTAYMYALMTGKRALILTETLGLQDQYQADFGREHAIAGQLVDIRGMRNYPCPALEPGGMYSHLRERKGKATCDVGPCKSGLPCPLRDGGCPGYDQQRAAQRAQIVSTSYANWLSQGKVKRDEDADETLGSFDVLIMDECHAAPDQVSKALTVELQLHELRDFFGPHLTPPPKSDDFAKWRPWIQKIRMLQNDALDGAMTEMRLARDGGVLRAELLADIRYLRQVGRELHLLERTALSDKDTDWVVEQVVFGRSGKSIITFQPVWPRPYAEQFLFRGVQRVVGMSATVRPKTMEYLGLTEKQFDFWEFDSSFPVEHRPIYFLPSVFMRYNMSEAEKKRWAMTIDSIGKSRLSNGIVHTVSYERARYYQSQAQPDMKHRLVEHTSNTTVKAVHGFKTGRVGQVLVSPSIATGYDFPDDACRWQVIGKVPFPDRRSKIMQRRMELDKEYSSYLAMTYLVQAIGRIVRGPQDWGETFIIDGVFGFGQKGGFYEKFKHYMPKWCRDAIKKINGIPKFKDWMGTGK